MDALNKNIYYLNEDGDKIYINSKGELHRLDGPAVKYKSGYKRWCKKGLRHRIDGPAIKYSNGDKEWFILDKTFDEKEFNSWIDRIKAFI